MEQRSSEEGVELPPVFKLGSGQAVKWGTAEKWVSAVKLLRMAVRKSHCEDPDRGCAGDDSGWKCNPAREDGLKRRFWSSASRRQAFFHATFAIASCAGFFHFQLSMSGSDRCERTVLELSGHLGLISRKVQFCVCPCRLYLQILSLSAWKSVLRKGHAQCPFVGLLFSCCPSVFFNPHVNVGSNL